MKRRCLCKDNSTRKPRKGVPTTPICSWKAWWAISLVWWVINGGFGEVPGGRRGRGEAHGGHGGVGFRHAVLHGGSAGGAGEMEESRRRRRWCWGRRRCHFGGSRGWGPEDVGGWGCWLLWGQTHRPSVILVSFPFFPLGLFPCFRDEDWELVLGNMLLFIVGSWRLPGYFWLLLALEIGVTVIPFVFRKNFPETSFSYVSTYQKLF